MTQLRCTINDVRSTFLKSIILILFFICYSTVQGQTTTVSDSLEKTRKPYLIDSLDQKALVPLDSARQQKQLRHFTTSDTLAKPVLEETAVKTKGKKQKKIDTTHYSPKTAAIRAAICPGLGQIYMKKYWKLPIVYGIMGAALYFVVSNGHNLREYNGYIRNVYDSIPNPSPIDQLSLSQIETYRNGYRKNLQIASFGTVIAWGLSIVDAVVDAHLHPFDVSDKLALKIKPQINYSNFTYYTGIGVNLSFK